MKSSKADLIIHPVRLRILLSLVDRELTAQQIAEMLSDVPPATLYRHLNKLVEAGVLVVLEERPVRAAIEKVYALANPAIASLGPADLAKASRDDHMRYFTSFVTSLLADFWRYLQQDQVDILADGVGYKQVPLYLSDEEFQQLVMDLNAVIAPAMAKRPVAGRRRRIFSTIVMPSPEKAEANAEKTEH